MKVQINLVVDKIDWAYSTKAKEIAKYNPYPDDWNFNIISYKEGELKLAKHFKESDLNLFFGFQNFKRCEKQAGVKKNNSLVSIASHASWDKGKTTPENQVEPDKEIIDYLKKFRSVSAVSLRLVDLFRNAGLPNIYFTPNGVPLDRFIFNNGRRFLHEPFVCCFAGRDVDEKKGHITYINEALKDYKKEEVKLNLAVVNYRKRKISPYSDNRFKLDYDKMPEFFRNSHLYICMSREEGSCRSVLEAMASGCAVISSDCGAARELLDSEDIIKRDVNTIREKVNYYDSHRWYFFRKIKKNRLIAEVYDWKNVTQYWYDWISENI